MKDRRTHGQEACCPACDRHTGQAAECPYCGCDDLHSPSSRLFRTTCLLLAVIGLFLLHLSATCRPPAIVNISDITPMMHHAHVRVRGVVERTPYIGRRNGRTDYCSFSLNDGTGSVRVSLYGEEARQLESHALPQRGWQLEATGDLKISGRKKRIVIRRVEDIAMLRACGATDS